MCPTNTRSTASWVSISGLRRSSIEGTGLGVGRWNGGQGGGDTVGDFSTTTVVGSGGFSVLPVSSQRLVVICIEISPCGAAAGESGGVTQTTQLERNKRVANTPRCNTVFTDPPPQSNSIDGVYHSAWDGKLHQHFEGQG